MMNSSCLTALIWLLFIISVFSSAAMWLSIRACVCTYEVVDTVNRAQELLSVPGFFFYCDDPMQRLLYIGSVCILILLLLYISLTVGFFVRHAIRR
jgi:hypothetical protein